MKKLMVCFFILFIGNAIADNGNDSDWINLTVDTIVRANTAECTTTQCLLDRGNQKTAAGQVVKKYGTGKGRCLAGIKRLLANGLGNDWFDGTVHAADYLSKMKKSDTFREVKCDRTRIVEYPNGTIFIIDRRHACKNRATPAGKKCSVSGHIMIKISDTREFAGHEQSLTRWSPYFGEDCWAFLPQDAKLPTAAESEPEDDSKDVCWIDDTSKFDGFEQEKPQDDVQDAIDKLRAAREADKQ